MLCERGPKSSMTGVLIKKKKQTQRGERHVEMHREDGLVTTEVDAPTSHRMPGATGNWKRQEASFPRFFRGHLTP